MNRSITSLQIAFGLALVLAATGCFSVIRSEPSSPQERARSAAAPMRHVQVHPYGDGLDPRIWTDGPGLNRERPPAIDSQTYVRLAAKVNPSVVSIFTTQKYRAGVGDPLGLFRIPFKDIYARALGSGFVIHADGFIVTNAHVVAEADEIGVLLEGEKEVYSARVIGLDTLSDVALLKIDPPSALPVLPLADSEDAKVGDVTVAIGNPFGLQHSLTIGVVSATQRRISQSSIKGGLENFIQTSAQINPGNSGGPLLNLAGEAIGVNTAVISQAQGIGFAIPSNLVKDLLPALIKDGRIERSFVGVLFAGGQTPYEGMDPEARSGVFVYGVYRGSPAAYAGVQRGDEVISVNGTEVVDPFEASQMIANLPVGSEVVLRLRRSGVETTVRMTTVDLGG